MEMLKESGINDTVTPIFIISLPRSGSTILQKKMALNPKIKTTGETWLMLPFIFALRKEGILSNYSHLIGHRGLMDVLDNLPNKEKDYYEALKLFADSIYMKLARDTQTESKIYFLDKTPRYYYIVEELGKIFPLAKFIFLVRNPLSIYSSTLHFGRNNRFSGLYNMHQDLYIGPSLLAKGYETLKDRSLLVSYDNLINDPEETLNKIHTYLEIFDVSEESTISIKGSLGDRKALNDNRVLIDKKSVNKWKATFNTLIRKRVIKKYITNIDERYLALLKLDRKDLLCEIDDIQVQYKTLLVDLWDWIKFKLILKFKLNLIMSKSMKHFKNNYYE